MIQSLLMCLMLVLTIVVASNAKFNADIKFQSEPIPQREVKSVPPIVLKTKATPVEMVENESCECASK